MREYMNIKKHIYLHLYLLLLHSYFSMVSQKQLNSFIRGGIIIQIQMH